MSFRVDQCIVTYDDDDDDVDDVDETWSVLYQIRLVKDTCGTPEDATIV